MPELLYSSSKSSSPTPSPVCRSRPRSHDHHTLLHFSSRTRPLPSPPHQCVISSYTKTDISRLITNISEAWKRRSLFIECPPGDTRASRPIGTSNPRDRTCREALERFRSFLSSIIYFALLNGKYFIHIYIRIYEYIFASS